MERIEVLHPLRLLAQPDGDVTTVIHSFFVVAYDPLRHCVDTIARHPLNRKNIDQAEDGVKQYLSDPQLFLNNEDFCVSRVMTNHDGRLFLFARCYRNKMISIVSALPILSFFRSLLNHLETAPIETILPTIYTFCEFPILPLPSVNYVFQLSSTVSAKIGFGNLKYVEDTDMDMIAMTLLTPFMMVKAWEAIILERSVLVVSKDTSLLLPCCEFIRKLISPMSYTGTYIPIMPSIDCLDAVGTFLMGADLNMVINSGVQLSGLVVLDLDRRVIIHTPIITGQNLPEDPYYGAPACLLQNIQRSIIQRTQEPLGKWVQRSFSKDYDIESSFSNTSSSKRCTEVLRIFTFLNTSLLSSQCCSTKGFFRTVLKPESDNIHYILGIDSVKEGVARMGYSEYFGFIVGCMQLWKDTELVDEAIHHTIFCWVELDNSSLAVYEHADDLPLSLIPIEEISAVVSCSIEPEGYVFEITLKNHLVFRFTSGDPHSRQLWVNAIEARIGSSANNKNNPSPALQTLQQIRNSDFDKRLNSDSENFSIRDLGHAPFLRDIDSTTANQYHEFLNLVRRTQAVLSLYGETQSSKFEQLFIKKRENFHFFLSEKHSYETKMKKYISNIYRTCDMLSTIKKDIDNNKLDELPTSLNGHSDTSIPIHDATLSPANGVSNRIVKQPSSTGISENGQDNNDGDRGKGIFSRFGLFSRKKSASKAEPGGADDNKTAPLTPADVEREQQEKNTLILMHKLFLVTLAYNRALSEINNTVVEDRFKLLNAIIQAAKNRVLNLHFTISDIISSCQAMSAEITQKYHRNSMSSKSPFRSRYPQFNNVDGTLFETLCDALVPPSIAFKNQFATRSVSYSQSAFLNTDGETGTAVTSVKTALSGEIPELHGDSVDGTNGNGILSASTRSPLAPTRIQFDEPREDSFTLPATQRSNTASSTHSPITTSAVDDPINGIDSSAIEVLTSDNCEDYELDVNEFLAATTDEYESMINTFHLEAKKQVLLFLQNEQKNNTKGELFAPVLSTLLGYVFHNTENYLEAIQYYSQSNLIHQSRISQCILNLFIQRHKQPDFATTFSEPLFIMEGFKVKSSVGMHSYRLILELLYTELKDSAQKKDGAPIVDYSIALGNFRSFFRGGQQTGRKAKPTAASAIRAEFEWSEPPQKSEVLNEAYICNKLTSELTPCEISTQLLVRLREVLRTYASSPAGEKFTKKVGTNMSKIKICPQTLLDLQNLSSFKKFELESCQLQKLDMNNATANERLFIFTNVYNMLMIHSIISRGSPGNTLLERTSFMRSAKYNVAGHVFSLIDIEHGILRNSSTKPMLLGPLSFDMSFSERDPRRKFALEISKPNISFCLFQASASSPPLCVLTDINHVDKEMSRYAKQYFLDSVKFDYTEKAIYLPALVKVYWADFGSKQNDVLRYIAQTAGSQFASKTKDYLQSIGGSSAKTHFATLDWTPVFLLNDS